MKKLLLLTMMALGLTANAQEGQFNLGANFGLPIGDISNSHSYTLGAEANYLFEFSDKLKAGPSASFVNFFGKKENIGGFDIGYGNVQFLPIAGAVRYSISDSIDFGADLGYGIGINLGNNGGFYYRPMVGYNISEKIMLQASYSGITSNGQNMSNVGIGVMFGL